MAKKTTRGRSAAASTREPVDGRPGLIGDAGDAPGPGAAAPPRAEFPVVGVGSSAGGVEALTRLLEHLPETTGMAFVVIQHLDPKQPSLLRSTLARSTRMAVVEAVSDMPVEPDRVHVIPPAMEMAIHQRRLVLVPRESPTVHHSIDVFFRALALEERNRAVGVLLSGTGSDGTEGLRVIRSEGGIALVEEPSSAKFPGMPQSAISAGAVDRILSIEELARELVHLSRQTYLVSPDAAAPEDDRGQAANDRLLERVFRLVREASGVDYSGYKSTTLGRRVARRMLLRRSESLSEYVALLDAEPAEVDALCRDILIHVTGFFRDPAKFTALAELAIPRLLQRHADGTALRIWVPGCSTGEEAYSIAISVLEVLGSDASRVPVQIFGSDLSAEMIDRARSGFYRDGALEGVSPQRLARFFARVEGGYRVDRAVRDKCVFVKHDLVRDPPFARLDLISCRNVLIYFGALLQKRVVPLFHFCLNPGGYLLLGHAESVAGFAELFSPVEKNSNLFVKHGTSRALSMRSLVRDDGGAPRPVVPERGPGPTPIAEAQKRADEILLGRFAPPGALVNATMQVIHLRGRTSPYLELRAGHPDLNLFRLAREDLVPTLRWALQKAKRELGPVRRDGVELRGEGGRARVNVEVIPVADPSSAEPCFLVLFEDVPPAGDPGDSPAAPPAPASPGGPGAHDLEMARLREEAAATGEYMQSLLDERQRMNDELSAANEELLSGNEELQSTIEELEAAKEELQSSNEELTTVNDELQLRHQELNQLNSDLVNVLASVEIPIVIVGGDRRIRRFTPQARELMNLVASDVGRPIDEIKLKVDVGDVDRLVSEVLDQLETKELEVRDRAGRWQRLQIRPYRSVDDKLDGAVLSLTDIDLLKRTAGDATAAFDQLAAVLQTICTPLIVLDKRLRLQSVNHAFAAAFGELPAGAAGNSFFDISARAWDVPELRSALNGLLAEGGERAVEIEIELPVGQRRTVVVAGSVLRWHREPPLLLLTPVDVTERASLLAATEEARAEAVRANRTKDVFLATASHELRAPLNAITMQADLLLESAADPERTQRAAERIALAARAQERIISDLLDVSAITAGKITLQRQLVDLPGVIAAVADGLRSSAHEKQIAIELRLPPAGSVGPVVGDANRLRQVFANLLSNAVKFSHPRGEVAVALERRDGAARIRVSDSGVGISPDLLPHVFDRFVQGDSSHARMHGGLGLGLAIVRDLVWLHGGTVQATSPGAGQGASFTVDLPLADEVAPDDEPDDGVEEVDTNPFGYEVGVPAATLRAEWSRAGLDGIRVLVVDDDDSSREVLVDILRLRSAEVLAVSSAQEALDALASFRPDVLLCDIAMPGEDGYSLIARVRALDPEEGGRTPAVALTALATEADQEVALSSGFDLYIAKPSPAVIVCQAVRRVAGHVVAAGGRRPRPDPV